MCFDCKRVHRLLEQFSISGFQRVPEVKTDMWLVGVAAVIGLLHR